MMAVLSLFFVLYEFASVYQLSTNTNYGDKDNFFVTSKKSTKFIR